MLSGKQLSIHSQGACTALTVKPLPSRFLGITISLLLESLSRAPLDWLGSASYPCPYSSEEVFFGPNSTPKYIATWSSSALRRTIPTPLTPTHGYRLVNRSGS